MVLVGPPGIGKSAVLAQSERIVRSIPEIHVAPSSVSSASLIDAIAEATQRKVRPAMIPPYIEYNSLSVIASELGVFLPTYENSFMNLLTKAYDGEFIEDRKRGGKLHIKIKSPLLSLAAGTTPSFLNSTLPEGAWDQGFTSRTIFIYSGEMAITPLFDNEEQHKYFEEKYLDLASDIKVIASLFGQFQWEPDAAKAITTWHMSGAKPVPDHTKLAYYVTRRTAHLLKLCMVASADRGNDLIITVDDYNKALEWILEAEVHMPDIFRAMSSGGDARYMEDCFHFAYNLYIKDNKPISEHRLMDFLAQRVPSHSTFKVLEVMIRSGYIEIVDYGAPQGRPRFKPVAKALRSL